MEEALENTMIADEHISQIGRDHRSSEHVELVNLLKNFQYFSDDENESDRERIDKILETMLELSSQHNPLNKLSKSERILLTKYFIVTDKGDNKSNKFDRADVEYIESQRLDELD